MKILTPQEQLARAAQGKKTERQQYLLEQYAGQALHGILAGELTRGRSAEAFISMAWNYADRMLEERNRRLIKKAPPETDEA